MKTSGKLIQWFQLRTSLQLAMYSVGMVALTELLDTSRNCWMHTTAKNAGSKWNFTLGCYLAFVDDNRSNAVFQLSWISKKGKVIHTWACVCSCCLDHKDCSVKRKVYIELYDSVHVNSTKYPNIMTIFWGVLHMQEWKKKRKNSLFLNDVGHVQCITWINLFSPGHAFPSEVS